MSQSLLSVDGLNAFYGDSHVLTDVALTVGESEVVGLLGRNGAGKSTTLKSIMGMMKRTTGQVVFNGKDVSALPASSRARMGLQLVPEERRIFGSITVEENLILAALKCEKPRSLAYIYQLFPRLEERRKLSGTQLSGGEQQMLAIARALIRQASLIMLDEPFEGLAPVIVKSLYAVCKKLAEDGQAIIIVEQNVDAILNLTDRCYIIDTGKIVYAGTSESLRHEDSQLIDKYISVG